ncbi:MAG: hypothetical protein HKN74_11495 [Acidimicrobiia bacterium]|nr:hypothetical protein [Acidimicrobiia bacterium]
MALPEKSQITVEVRPRTVVGILVVIAGLLVLAHYGGLAVGDGFDQGWRSQLRRITDLNDETSIGTWYSSALLLLTAALAALHLNRGHYQDRLGWAVVAGAALFLSIDEATAIHERLDVLHEILDLNTATTFLWIVPYSLGLIGVIAVLRPFLGRLPARTKRWLLIGVGLYLTAVLGLELVAAGARELSWDTLVEDVLIPIEEGLEMVGISVFIFALLDLARPTVDAERVKAALTR